MTHSPAPEKATFEIRHSPSNRAGTIPAHWDVHLAGQDDSIMSCWESREMAEEFTVYLEHRHEFKAWLAERGAKA